MSSGEPRRDVAAARMPASRVLFAVLGGPVAWAVHFLGSYALVGTGCPAGWAGIHVGILGLTVVLAAVAVAAVAAAYRAWRRASGDQAWDLALTEPGGWLPFLLLTGVMLGGVSVFTILLEGLPSLIVPACPLSTQ